MANVTPMGYPHYGAGTVEILVKDVDGVDYSLLFAPDPKNNELRNAGLPMQFYYYPKAPRLAKHSDGRFKFSMQVFKSTGDESTVIGAEGLEEEAGAFTSLTSTIDVPEPILLKAIEKFKTIIEKQFGTHRNGLLGLFSWLRGKDKDITLANIRPVQLIENNISMHIIGEEDPDKQPFGGLNPWTMNVQGKGPGQTFGLGENAFSIMMGRNSASLLKASLESGGNNLVIENVIKYKAYMPTTIIRTVVKASRVHKYFSSKLSVPGRFIDFNWEHEYEKLRTSGAIETEIITDEQFSTEDRKRLEESLIEKQRDYAFKAVEKCIFEPEIKKFTPAKEPDTKRTTTIRFLGISISVSRRCVGWSLKTAADIKELDFIDEVKLSSICVLDSKISGNLDPLIKKGDQETLKQYVSEVRLDEDFAKVHIITALNGSLVKMDRDNEILNDSPVSQVAIEVGYPDSKGNMIWKSSGRMIAEGGTPYIQKTSRSGKTVDAIYPALWNSPAMDQNLFVFDFVRNTPPSEVTVRQEVMYEKDKRVKVKDKKAEFVFKGTKVFIELPVLTFVDYSLSAEELYECDTLEVTLKVDKMSAKTFKFSSENFGDIIPYKVWYEAGYSVKPTEYKVKYTCKGKVNKALKKVTINSGWQKLDYLEGDVIFEIPSGTESQNEAVQAIRRKFTEEE